jgi:lipid-binding SYLF domain-containing protein
MSIQYGQEQEDEEQRQQVQSVKRRDLLNRISRSVNSWVELVKKLEIPRNLLEESDGLILVQAFKFGILASVSYGNGILLVQNRRSRKTIALLFLKFSKLCCVC